MDWAKIITALKGAKWYLIVATFLAFNAYLFREPLTRLFDYSTDKVFEGDIVPIVEKNLFVDKLLRSLMYSSAGDRAYIFRFHNGQNYFDGTHKIRMSCDFEVVEAGVQPQAARLRDLPASLFSWFIKESIDYKMFYHNTDTIPDVTTKVALSEQGVKSIAVAPCFDKDGNLVALVGVDWVRRVADTALILEHQGLQNTNWDSEYQKQRFIRAVQGINQALKYNL